MLPSLSLPYHSNNTKVSKMHVNGLEVMHRNLDSVTTGQVRIIGHLSAQFV